MRSPPRRLCPDDEEEPPEPELELELDEDEPEDDELDDALELEDDELEDEELEEDELDDAAEDEEDVIGVGSDGAPSQAAATPATRISVPCDSRIRNSRRACSCSSLI
jgi:hypothetical protein